MSQFNADAALVVDAKANKASVHLSRVNINEQILCEFTFDRPRPCCRSWTGFLSKTRISLSTPSWVGVEARLETWLRSGAVGGTWLQKDARAGSLKKIASERVEKCSQEVSLIRFFRALCHGLEVQLLRWDGQRPKNLPRVHWKGGANTCLPAESSLSWMGGQDMCDFSRAIFHLCIENPAWSCSGLRMKAVPVHERRSLKCGGMP